MKTRFALFLVLIMALTLTACSKDIGNDIASQSSNATGNIAETNYIAITETQNDTQNATDHITEETRETVYTTDASPAATDYTEGNAVSQTVYITQTGKKYHSEKDCPGLSNAKAIYDSTLTDAKNSGLEPCAKCH